jgi:hypothetical protein
MAPHRLDASLNLRHPLQLSIKLNLFFVCLASTGVKSPTNAIFGAFRPDTLMKTTGRVLLRVLTAFSNFSHQGSDRRAADSPHITGKRPGPNKS